ncbi:MAG: DUF1727 domain-containing protein [Methanobacteriaceae archaeon]|jgi:UDP-N-acetylmuramyl tripeptide synthase|nr:DUF1727 domain-containing protein [Methanobacteriaceae archaeon]
MKNDILFKLSFLISRLIYLIVRKMGKKGTALPGKIAMKIKPDILNDLSSRCDNIAIVSGTNGKTTTNNLSNHIFKGKDFKVLSNLNGSNMIQGVISPFIIDKKKHYDWGIFEVDEGSMPVINKYMVPDYIILTNFFRDQLDRYGEVEKVIKTVYDSIKHESTTLILNGDSPTSLYFDDLKNSKIYYSLEKTKFSRDDETSAESVTCPKCNNKLNYEYITYGNIGKYYCLKCGVKNPKPHYVISKTELKDNLYDFTVCDKYGSSKIKLGLLGIYNLYNVLGAISLARENNFSYDLIKKQIENFEFKEGRMEIINTSSSKVILGLTKNPIGLSEILSIIWADNSKKSVMFVLNDYAPDGRDISWIWDVFIKENNDFSNIDKFFCVGTRAEEIALRLKYIDFPEEKLVIYHSKDRYDIEEPILTIISQNNKNYILGTFTAMPEAKKIIMKIKKEESL